MKVFDVFPYWRERWAVEARLRLWDGVEGYRPVGILGDRTHRGKWLPHFNHDTSGFPADVEKIVVALDADGDWGREAQQRDAVRQLLRHMEPDDLILLCDADELVDPRALPRILAATEQGPVKLRMAHYMAGTRWRHRDWWRHAGACRARDLPEHPTADLRMNFGAIPRVPDAGWHLTYLGSDADVDLKLSAFAHVEYDTAQTRVDIARLRETGEGWIDDPLTGPLADILADVLAVTA